jgi:hypothetical protein
MGAADLHGSYANTWQGFWNHVLARGYVGFFTENSLWIERTPDEWFALFREQFGAIGLALSLLGLIKLLAIFVHKQPPFKAWSLIGLALVANLIFALYYRVSDVEVFLLPAFLGMALLIGAGVAFLARLAVAVGAPVIALQGLLLAVVAMGLGGRGNMVNRSQDWEAHDYAVAMATVDFPPLSRVIGLEGEMTALKYMQQAEGLGSNAQTVIADDPEQRRRALQTSMDAGYPTYLTRELAGIESLYSFSGEGPLVRVWPRGQARAATPQHTLAVTIAENGLRLEGYDLERLAEAGGPTARVALYWRPLRPLTQVLKVSLRLLDANGAPLLWPDGRPATVDRFPLRQAAFTTTWLAGELTKDVHHLRVPPTSSSLPIRLQIIVYDAETVMEVGRWQLVE